MNILILFQRKRESDRGSEQLPTVEKAIALLHTGKSFELSVNNCRGVGWRGDRNAREEMKSIRFVIGQVILYFVAGFSSLIFVVRFSALIAAIFWLLNHTVGIVVFVICCCIFTGMSLEKVSEKELARRLAKNSKNAAN